ncbi:hypothetical protein DBV15_06325 [Temnothorax longispinosus]|uniref:Uncharacterized protein n=1 Tax=Temnothorax longispinosus TaxID=300112 RepID=A0A4S2KNF1_9HYME|nr:hypothetical protein DBV15_06325 [Temnothorax longispinosus]
MEFIFQGSASLSEVLLGHRGSSVPACTCTFLLLLPPAPLPFRYFSPRPGTLVRTHHGQESSDDRRRALLTAHRSLSLGLSLSLSAAAATATTTTTATTATCSPPATHSRAS